MKKISFLSLIILATSAVSGFSQSTATVNWQNFSFTPANQTALLLRDASGNPLSQGTGAVNTDGMLVQLGYYSAGTAANPFAGTWTPLTGFGPTLHTTVGDSPDLSGFGNGVIGFTTGFTIGVPAVEVYAPTDAGHYFTQSSVSISATIPP